MEPRNLRLTVDTDRRDVLRIVLESTSGTAIRDDFPEEVAAVCWRESKKNPAKRCNWLTMTRFGAVDDKRAVLGHQRDIAVENFLFLDVANGFRAVARPDPLS